MGKKIETGHPFMAGICFDGNARWIDTLASHMLGFIRPVYIPFVASHPLVLFSLIQTSSV